MPPSYRLLSLALLQSRYIDDDTISKEPRHRGRRRKEIFAV